MEQGARREREGMEMREGAVRGMQGGEGRGVQGGGQEGGCKEGSGIKGD